MICVDEIRTDPSRINVLRFSCLRPRASRDTIREGAKGRDMGEYATNADEPTVRGLILTLVSLAVVAERAALRSDTVCRHVVWLLWQAESAVGYFVFEATGTPPPSAYADQAEDDDGPLEALRLAACLQGARRDPRRPAVHRAPARLPRRLYRPLRPPPPGSPDAEAPRHIVGHASRPEFDPSRPWRNVSLTAVPPRALLVVDVRTKSELNGYIDRSGGFHDRFAAGRRLAGFREHVHRHHGRLDRRILIRGSLRGRGR